MREQVAVTGAQIEKRCSVKCQTSFGSGLSGSVDDIHKSKKGEILVPCGSHYKK